MSKSHYQCPAPGLRPFLCPPCGLPLSLLHCFVLAFSARAIKHLSLHVSSFPIRASGAQCLARVTVAAYRCLVRSSVEISAALCGLAASSVSRPLSCCVCFTSPCGVRPHRCSGFFYAFSCTRNAGSPFKVWTVLGSKRHVLSAGRFASLHTCSLASFERACRRGSSCFAAAQGMVGAG